MTQFTFWHVGEIGVPWTLFFMFFSPLISQNETEKNVVLQMTTVEKGNIMA